MKTSQKRTENTLSYLMLLESSFNVYKPLLTKNGIYISTELGKNSENIWYSIMTSHMGQELFSHYLQLIKKM